MTSWKRRWLKSPVSSSVTAWRCTVSCRSTFSTDTAAWLVRYENSSRSPGRKLRSPRIGDQPALSGEEAAVAAGHGDDRQHAVAALGGRQRRRERRRSADLD